MDFNGAFSSIMERKEDKYLFWELTYEFWMNYGFYRENTEFTELNNF